MEEGCKATLREVPNGSSPSPLPEPAVSTKGESTYWQIEGEKKLKTKRKLPTPE